MVNNDMSNNPLRCRNEENCNTVSCKNARANRRRKTLSICEEGKRALIVMIKDEGIKSNSKEKNKSSIVYIL